MYPRVALLLLIPCAILFVVWRKHDAATTTPCYPSAPISRYPSVCRPIDHHDGKPAVTACAYFERLADALDYATRVGDVVNVPPGKYEP